MTLSKGYTYAQDGYMIDGGEDRKAVIRRLLGEGLSVEDTVKESQYPVDYVESCIEEAYNSEHCVVYYRPELKAVYLKWKQFSCSEAYRTPCEYLLQLMKQHQCEAVLVNAINGFEDTKEDVEWAFTYFIPSLAATRCRKLVFLMGGSNDLDHEIDMFTREFMKYFQVERCHSLEEAATLLLCK